tara:strand:- start:61 stop:198 length:138 start_codon:yes stop_codon:yes gene_type:complete
MEIELVLPDSWEKSKADKFQKAFEKKLAEEVFDKHDQKEDDEQRD